MKIGITLGLLLTLVALSIPIGALLTLLAMLLTWMFSSFPLQNAMGDIVWSASTDFVLIAVPIFILMGELMLRSGIAGGMFNALSKMLAVLPGGLMHANIGASALFAATSGSSVATAATIGTVATPHLRSGGYNKSLFLGSIAAGGTLGILIPPSINMIVYGVLAEVSIRSLYIAAVIPGILLAFLFSALVIIICLVRPDMGGQEKAGTLKEIFASLPSLFAPLILFMTVVGSIYAGFATASEAAALGLIATLIIAGFRRQLNWSMIFVSCESAMRTTAMVMLIIVSAFFLNFVLSSTGLTATISKSIAGLDFPPLGTLLIIIAIYLVLGCFMETLTLMVATTPIVVPVIVAIGYDPIWFGVLFMVLIEAALITPPIGMNLFVVQTIYPSATSWDVAKGAAPFLLAMLLMMALLIAFPSLALGLL
ncbi:MAG TPA: TRAP transporter large permease [Devosia sp.]|nr:TRAP transporter large permease [Devosia sp.]